MQAINNLLFLDLDKNSGVVELVHALQNQTLILKKALITWDDVTASAAAGEFVNLDIQAFSHNRINSNRKSTLDALPIFNDVTKAVSFFTADIPVDTDSNMKQSFQYAVYDRDGALVSNFVSMQLVFSYSEPAIF